MDSKKTIGIIAFLGLIIIIAIFLRGKFLMKLLVPINGKPVT